jgi:hypothetical protein
MNYEDTYVLSFHFTRSKVLTLKILSMGEESDY